MRTGPVILAMAVLLALAGCVPSDSHPSSAPSPSATPVFASDAEALAAAEKAYAAYLKVSDQIANDGGKDPDRIAAYVATSRLDTELQGSKVFQSRRIHTNGATTFDNPSLQQVISDVSGTQVVLYVCWDATQIRIIDANGADVTPSDRAARQTLEIVLATTGRKLPLLLKSDESWSGQSSC